MSSQIELAPHAGTTARPMPATRKAMASAAVGNEHAGAGPATRRLQAMAGDPLGREAAAIPPSGTLCAQINYRLHTEPGDVVILDRTSRACVECAATARARAIS